MSIHADFFNYSEENILRARKLFDEGDFRYAIFSAQEGIELALKGYLIHYDLLKNPKNAGHLPYTFILKTLENEIKHDSRVPKNSKEFWNESIKHIKNVGFVFTELKKESVCIAFWKNSLNIELSSEDKRIFSEINEKLQFSLKKELFSVDKYFLTHNVKNKVNDLKAPQEIRDMSKTLVQYRDILTENLTADISDFGKDLYKNVESFLNRPDLADIKKLFTIVKTMNWMPIVAYAFSHQQISRYPTYIDIQLVNEFYKKRQSELKLLIDKIDNCCQEMQDSCTSLYSN